jgi:ribosomal protein S18 acetylase RimI-like enzyme
MTTKDSRKQELQVIIREMKEDDIGDIMEIDRKITDQNRAATYSATPRNFLGGQMNMSVVAEADNKVVGFLFGQMISLPYQMDDIALAQTMGVDPDYRRRHIGQRLMQGFYECCKKQGADSVHVMVSVHDRKLLAFFRSLDFVQGEITEFVKTLD